MDISVNHLNNSIANHNSLCNEATNALLLQPAVRMSAASPTICLTSSFFTLSCTHQGSMSCNFALKMHCSCPDSRCMGMRNATGLGRLTLVSEDSAPSLLGEAPQQGHIHSSLPYSHHIYSHSSLGCLLGKPLKELGSPLGRLGVFWALPAV